jgi:hypothetical protein
MSHYAEQLIKPHLACYAITVLKYFVHSKTLVMIYYAYFHTVMKYDIHFWGNSPYSIYIFRLQNKRY